MQDFINGCHAGCVKVRSHIVGQLKLHIPNIGTVSLRQGEIRNLTKMGIANLKASEDLKNYIATGDIEIIPV